MSFAKRIPPEQSLSESSTEIVQSLIVDLLKEARRQLELLSQSNTGSDSADDVQNRENVKLRAINVRTLAGIVEIVQKILDLQLQLQQMGAMRPATGVETARASLQNKIAGIVSELLGQDKLAFLEQGIANRTAAARAPP